MIIVTVQKKIQAKRLTPLVNYTFFRPKLSHHFFIKKTPGRFPTTLPKLGAEPWLPQMNEKKLFQLAASYLETPPTFQQNSVGILHKFIENQDPQSSIASLTWNTTRWTPPTKESSTNSFQRSQVANGSGLLKTNSQLRLEGVVFFCEILHYLRTGDPITNTCLNLRHIYIYIPGTQLTLVLIGKDLFWGVDLQK